MKNHKTVIKFFISFLFFAKGFVLFAQQDSIATGKKIFETYCGSCHNIHYEIIGPALASITKKRNVEWLIAFIKNSQNVIASGDEYANHLAQQYDHVVMPSFKLSDDEIKNVLLYIERESIRSSQQLNELQQINTISEDGGTDVLHGQDLFRNQCASCHAVHAENYGPALASVTKRRPTAWLVNFIKNSQQVIGTGDSYSVHLFEKFNKKIMVSMEFLSESEIHDILKYIEYTSGHTSIKNKLGQKSTFLHANKNAYVESTSPDRFFLIFFIVLTSVGAVIQGFLVVKFYRHLEKMD